MQVDYTPDPSRLAASVSRWNWTTLIGVTALTASLLGSTPLRAQQADSTATVPPHVGALITIGSPADDRSRVAQLLGLAPTAGYMIRSASTLTPPLAPERGSWQLLAPELLGVWNSAIPFSLNDGSLWAGRGANARLLVGARAAYGPLSLTVAPELSHSANREFDILPRQFFYRRPGQSVHGWIWNNDARTIDLPWRFGSDAYTVIYPGQSALTLSLGAVAAGFSTEDQWWGPGVRNAIVLSNNAPGVPHLFLRTTRPIRTGLGEIEGRWLVGALTESPFFDGNRENDLRSLSGAILTFSPALEPNLTVGATRVVYRRVESVGAVPLRAFDVLTQWERRSSPADTAWAPRAEQLYALFGRWVMPEDGFEVYAEWARHERALSFADLLAAPNHSHGYTLGVGWAREVGRSALWLRAEATTLEQSPTFKQRAVGTFYTSRGVPQGYTNRGQVMGAAIGPGSSSQWVAADFLNERLRFGVFGNRIRWNTDALYTARSLRWPEAEPPRSFHSYDVSLIGGVRAGGRIAGWDVDAEWSRAARYNYLFQNLDYAYGGADAVDIDNHSISIRIGRSITGAVAREPGR